MLIYIYANVGKVTDEQLLAEVARRKLDIHANITQVHTFITHLNQWWIQMSKDWLLLFPLVGNG